MTDDPLSPLLALADVSGAVDEARAVVDRALWHRALRRQGGVVAAEVSLRSAVASAALEGHGYDREAVRAGVVTDPVVHGAVRVAAALPGLVETWRQAPLQVLARLHVLAAKGVVDAAHAGRPARASAGPRLETLAHLVAGRSVAPPPVLAAVVHGELLALDAFAGPNGLVARGAARLVLLAGGFDPRGLVAPELGHLAREPEYVGAARAFATGTPDGIRSWLRHCATALALGAEDLTAVCDAVQAGTLGRDTWTAPQS